ncbi:hypothetical protein KC333_g152 [Hortaea werneckii]|nr:hypothetical protein KC333_g152 [Hortaea werneckii]
MQCTIPLAAAPAPRAFSPSGPTVFAIPMGQIQTGMLTSHPNMVIFVLIAETFLMILGRNQSFCQADLLALSVRRSLDALETLINHQARALFRSALLRGNRLG